MPVIIIIIIILLSYSVLLLQYRTSARKGARDIVGALVGTNSLHLLNRRTIYTTPFMVLSLAICLAAHKNIFLGLNWNEKSVSIAILLLFSCLLLSVFSGFQAKEKLAAAISIEDGRSYLSLRVGGLIVYETFFRGVLLGISLQWSTQALSIGINMILYALAHAFSSRKEFLGSAVFGWLLCYITILFESVYPAVILHLSLALPYEIILLTKCQILTKKIKS